MNFWHMQLHPDAKGLGKEKEILDQLGVIGLDIWEKGASQIKQFKEDMQIRDIVLIKAGKTPIALVEVTSEAYIESELDSTYHWLKNRRRVKVLKYIEGLNDFPSATKTLTRAVNKTTPTYKYIKNIYKTIRTSTGLKKEFLLQDSDIGGHVGAINSMIYLDDNTIVSGSDDSSIKIWDIKKQECICTLKGHSSWIQALVQIDENTIASASGDETIKIWDIKKQECICTLKGHSSWIKSLEKIDENTIVSGSDDAKIKIWDIKKQECISTLKGHSGWIQSLI